jgi:lipopolysaccharide export system ATP-binding protein
VTILSFFRGALQRRRGPGSSFWDIDLRSLGGPILPIRTEPVNLPGKKKKKRRPDPRPVASLPARDAPVRDSSARDSAPRDLSTRDLSTRDLSTRDLSTRESPPRESPTRDDINGAVTRLRPREDAAIRPPPRPEVSARPTPRSEPPVRLVPRSDGAARASGQSTFLATHAVEKSFGGRKVVNGASIYVRRGEAVGLLGPNGAGKTTVFYMITGLIKADRGRIELDGHDITRLPMYQRARLGIGYLPQEASIFRGLNVEENIRAVLEVVEPNRRRREADLNALLEEFNIARLRKTPSIALSGGERRRVEIARALASRPNYMLLDEPFAGIDPIAVGDIQALVRHLTNRGIGVLITDHNVRETLGLTDRAYIIYSGSVLKEGQPDEIVNDPEVRQRYLGEDFRM